MTYTVKPRQLEEIILSYYKDDMTHVKNPHCDALIITVETDKFDMKIILVEKGDPKISFFLDNLKN